MKREKSHKSRLRRFREQMEAQMRGSDPSTFRLYLVLRALVIVAGIAAMLEHRYEYVAMCALVLLLFLVPSFIERQMKIELPSTLEKIILLYNESIYETSDVIASFVYRYGMQKGNYSYATAVGLFNSLFNFLLLILVNGISRKVNETSLW